MDEEPRPPKRRPKPNTRRVWMLALVFVGGCVWLLVAAIRRQQRDTMFALRADMQNLAVAQAAYYHDNATFATTVPGQYRAMRGSRVRIEAGSDTSWSATATHPRTSKVCTMNYSEPRSATRNQVSQAKYAAMRSYACK